MRTRDRGFTGWLLPVLLLTTGCGGTAGSAEVAAPTASPTAASSATSSTPSSNPTPTSNPTPASSPTPSRTPILTPTSDHTHPPDTTEPAPVAPDVRTVLEQDWTPLATVGGVTLHHPSRRVERIGFHQSNHEGARQLAVLDTAVAPITMESRGRLTGARTAADVVSDPDLEIRAPVTGTVVRAGTYVLYCEYSDDFVVIDPDGHPGWEVKILHIDGEQVDVGQRVEAGVTVLASRPTVLPFASQVDEHTADPNWPHVHIEVVDPSIENIPSPGGGC